MGREKKSLWREFLLDANICIYSEGHCPCDKDHTACSKCLEPEVFERYVKYRDYRNKIKNLRSC